MHSGREASLFPGPENLGVGRAQETAGTTQQIICSIEILTFGRSAEPSMGDPSFTQSLALSSTGTGPPGFTSPGEGHLQELHHHVSLLA
jgi:hypothetical protein